MSDLPINERKNKNVVTGGNVWDNEGSRSGKPAREKSFGRRVFNALIKTCGIVLFIIILVNIYKHPELITNLF